MCCWDQEVSGHLMSCDLYRFCNRILAGKSQRVFVCDMLPLTVRVLSVIITVYCVAKLHGCYMAYPIAICGDVITPVTAVWTAATVFGGR